MGPHETAGYLLIVTAGALTFLLGVILTWCMGSRDAREHGWWTGYEQQARHAGQQYAQTQIAMRRRTQVLPVRPQLVATPVSWTGPKHLREEPDDDYGVPLIMV